MTISSLPDDKRHTCVGVTRDIMKRVAKVIARKKITLPQYVVISSILAEWAYHQEQELEWLEKHGKS